MGFFSKIKEGLKKTRSQLADNINSVINSFTKIDEDLFEELEESPCISLSEETIAKLGRLGASFDVDFI